MENDYAMLTDRQREQAEATAELAVKFGMFDQTSFADGAHYAAKNPFVAEGLMCKNCVFFDETNSQCQVVAGPIVPEAICKLWVIPENMIAGYKAEAAEPMVESAVNLREFYIRNDAADCKGWATTDGAGKVITCHETKDQAIKHMVAASIGAGEQPGGDWAHRKNKK
jgi:hypothetical protein